MQRILDRLVAGHPAVTAAARGGGTVLDIRTATAAASVALQGAQVLSWAPTGRDDVLWCSPLSPLGGGKAIRGGIPVCWPWFGPHAREATWPQHGFARNHDWQCTGVETDVNGSDVRLSFALPMPELRRMMLEAGVGVTLVVTVGRELRLELETRNGSGAAVSFTTALHTYFAVGDVAAVEVVGLDGCDFRDNTDAGRIKRQNGAIRFTRETIAVFERSPATVVLADPSSGRRVRIERGADSPSTIVWNPGANAVSMADIPPGGERKFVCIESGAVGTAAMTLAPGAVHRLSVRYAVE